MCPHPTQGLGSTIGSMQTRLDAHILLPSYAHVRHATPTNARTCVSTRTHARIHVGTLDRMCLPYIQASVHPTFYRLQAHFPQPNKEYGFDIYEVLSHYEVLGVCENANSKQIKLAFRRRLLVCHPDKNLDDQLVATEKMKLVNAARECLVDAQARAKYNLDWPMEKLRREEEKRKEQEPERTGDTRSHQVDLTSSTDEEDEDQDSD